MKGIATQLLIFLMPVYLFCGGDILIDKEGLETTIEILYINRTQHGGNLSWFITEEDWDKMSYHKPELKKDLKDMFDDLFHFSSKNNFEKIRAEEKFTRLCKKWNLSYSSFDDLIK